MENVHNKVKNTQEYNAVRIYLEYFNYKIIDSYLKKEETDIDFVYDNGKEILNFQVTTPEGEVQKLIKNKIYDGGYKYNEVVNKSILEPINRKINRYGSRQEVSEIILIIHSIMLNPFIDKLIEDYKGEIKERAIKSKFKSIYLVSQLKEVKKII